jgi:diguanylate cyclase (GGDEF)-like protein
MNKSQNFLEIIAIGFHPELIEAVKSALLYFENDVRLTFKRRTEELIDLSKRNSYAIFFYSNRLSKKTIEEIRRINNLLPGAAITLVTTRNDIHGIVKAFRSGLFDYLAFPLEPNEIRTVIYRLKIHEAIQFSNWTPERAMLHFFSRPESFFSILDVTNSLNQYLRIFFKIKKEIVFNLDPQIISSLQKKINLKDNQAKRVRRFLIDETGLIFGLGFISNKFFFLQKRGDGKVSYVVAVKNSEFSAKDILSPYLSNVIKSTLTILEESRKREAIRMLSLTDEVTGLFNQRKLVEDLDYHIECFKNEQIGFSLLFIDIDYFKNVNDQYGHVYGGQLLRDISKVFKDQLRFSDLIYRYGGDEFIVILPRTNIDETKKIALRISEVVKGIDFKIGDNTTYRLSISIGVAHYPTDASSSKSVIDFADKMMYQSKKNGRGKVFYVTEVMK